MTDERRTYAVKQKAAMESLLNCPGWTMLIEVLRSGLQTREQQVLLTPLSEGFGVYAQEFTKGEINAYRTLLAFPESVLEDAKAIIAQFPLKENEDGEPELDD